MEKRQGARAEGHRRRVVVRCACGKSLATTNVVRGGVSFEWSEGVRFDLPIDDDTDGNGSYYGGGEMVRCTDKDCGAGPGFYRDGELDRLIVEAAKAGDRSLKLPLKKRD